MSSDNEGLRYSSSDESIVKTQGTKLFKYADVDNRGYIEKADLKLIKDYVSSSHLLALENMMRESNESYISEKEFIQMLNDLAEAAPMDIVVNTSENILDHSKTFNTSAASDSYNLASELSAATAQHKYEDPLVDMLRDTMEMSMTMDEDDDENVAKLIDLSQTTVHIPTVMITPCENSNPRSQLDSPDYPFIVENVASRQSTPTIMEKPAYAVSIKKPQYRPIEPGDMQLSSAILGAPSLADELSEAEEGNNPNYQNQLDKGCCTPDRIFKVVFVGDSAVGKTCFLHRFCHNRFKPLFNATIGVDFTVKTIAVQDRLITLQLWDTAGQERFRSITKQYFRKADGVVLMFDVTSEQSFLHVRNWIDSVKMGVDENTVMCLVGNKVDLFGNDNSRKTIFQAGRKLAQEFHMPFFETSAFTGYGIENCMKAMAISLQKREDDHLEEALRLEQHPSPKRRSWCCL